ncbi:hypothetical protein BKA70DRAFT_1563097 [Coprinopsis sp. MPI-PUGE-AT-0042]|nr:hypothetical protein BKA70DRAFT_1563097 [Coprinopsis sp. MPI-PUGE-AT-0042]
MYQPSSFQTLTKRGTGAYHRLGFCSWHLWSVSVCEPASPTWLQPRRSSSTCSWSKTMTSGLPSELAREIVGYFSRPNDIGALQAASLVCSDFRDRCQEEIFSAVRVYKQHCKKNDTAHHLAGLEIFRQNSTLLSYIKTVSVQHSPGMCFGLYDEEPMELVNAELIELIATPSVVEFSFVGWEGKTSAKFHRGIFALVRSPHLISLSLTYAPVQLANMVESLHLQHLELRESAYYLWGEREKQVLRMPFQSTVTKRKRKRPTSLALQPDGPAIDLLLEKSSSLDLSAVEELALDSPCYTQGDILSVIQRCSPSLRRLRITTDAIRLLDLTSCLVQLQQVQELIINPEPRFGHRNPCDVLPSFLDAFPSPNALSYVEIKNFYEAESHFPGGALQLWKRLDSILANRSRFAKLHTLKFRRTVVIRAKPTPEEWEEKQRDYWLALKEVGVVIEMPRGMVIKPSRSDWHPSEYSNAGGFLEMPTFDTDLGKQPVQKDWRHRDGKNSDPLKCVTNIILGSKQCSHCEGSAGICACSTCPRGSTAECRPIFESFLDVLVTGTTSTSSVRTVSPVPPPRPTVVQHQANCDGCQWQLFSGPRYKCNNCYDFDLCDSCYRLDRHIETGHHFRKYETPDSSPVYLAARTPVRAPPPLPPPYQEATRAPQCPRQSSLREPPRLLCDPLQHLQHLRAASKFFYQSMSIAELKAFLIINERDVDGGDILDKETLCKRVWETHCDCMSVSELNTFLSSSNIPTTGCRSVSDRRDKSKAAFEPPARPTPGPRMDRGSGAVAGEKMMWLS